MVARGDSNARPLPCQGKKINNLQTLSRLFKDLQLTDLDSVWTPRLLPCGFGLPRGLQEPEDGRWSTPRWLD
jgi:hypothetical protein